MEKDLKRSYYGIMLDINYFKNINDEFGHAEGDKALCELAAIINDATRTEGASFRYAGDEFVIIIKTDSEEYTKNVENDIREKIEQFNKQKKHQFELHVAMGYDKFLNGIDNEDSFMKKIDAAMYANKKEMHRLCELKAQKQ